MGNNNSLPTVGYHVLQVAPNSPAEYAGIEAYFDFIVSVNGTVIQNDDIFFSTIAKNIGNEVTLNLYNTNSKEYRDVVLSPSNTWGGAGSAGLSVRISDFTVATEHVWHILEVQKNSPASHAGLESFTDYIVGSPDVVINSCEEFYTMVNNATESLPVYVYSTKSERIRIVNITPNKEWGGNGCIGCDIGYGYLHRIPTKSEKAPGDKPSPTNSHIIDIAPEIPEDLPLQFSHMIDYQ
eukprot:TRINITY_DN11922_c0_g1_i1.p1 TRINITY_DN11922_c0_g1~~TRINITY_DN11922_c0_g1_i1.p1  ORF type:complete len:238 (-),score=41.12 TRINITY_DN11922_c0_g1_i1:38-751(-)